MTPRVEPDSPAAWTRAARVLRAGGVAALPTDTLYGLHALADHGAAVDRIRSLKGLDASRPLVHLAADLAMVERLVAGFGAIGRGRLAAAWPAPLTVVLPARDGATVAVRVPAHAALRALVATLGAPVVSTSVNRHGEPPRVDAASIAADFDVDLVIDGGRLVGRASTLVDATGEGVRVIRPGDYAPAADAGWSGGGKPSKA